MAKEIKLQNIELNRFIADERNKVVAYLRKNFSISDDDLNDIYQESSMALFLNYRDGKLLNLKSTLSTYFFRICINQTLKFTEKQKKVVPLIDESTITNKDAFRTDKIDELYQLCTEDENANIVSRTELIVQNIIDSMPDTCKYISKVITGTILRQVRLLTCLALQMQTQLKHRNISAYRSFIKSITN